MTDILDRAAIFYEHIDRLGMTESQSAVISALFEECFNHPEANYIYYSSFYPQMLFTYRGLEKIYSNTQHLINRYTYWLHQELVNGRMQVFESKIALKEFILANLDMYYYPMFGINSEEINSTDDFNIGISHSRNGGIKNRIDVTSSRTGKLLFSITLKTGDQEIYSKLPIRR
jgi:hypothetical protein